MMHFNQDDLLTWRNLGHVRKRMCTQNSPLTWQVTNSRGSSKSPTYSLSGFHTSLQDCYKIRGVPGLQFAGTSPILSIPTVFLNVFWLIHGSPLDTFSLVLSDGLVIIQSLYYGIRGGTVALHIPHCCSVTVLLFFQNTQLGISLIRWYQPLVSAIY